MIRDWFKDHESLRLHRKLTAEAVSSWKLKFPEEPINVTKAQRYWCFSKGEPQDCLELRNTWNLKKIEHLINGRLQCLLCGSSGELVLGCNRAKQPPTFICNNEQCPGHFMLMERLLTIKNLVLRNRLDGLRIFLPAGGSRQVDWPKGGLTSYGKHISR